MYGAYSLAGLPPAARPETGRAHRGEHSYTVTATQESSEAGVQTALIDVLLRTQAFYIKKAPWGRTGQVSWRKHGGKCKAWAVTLVQAFTKDSS